MSKEQKQVSVLKTARALKTARGAFQNWPRFLSLTLRGRQGGSSTVGSVRTKRGTVITFVNTPMGRAPLWEVFASDDYPWRLLLEVLADGSPTVVDIGAHVGAFTLAVNE